MRIVLQRVLSASVQVDGVEVGAIERGLCLLAGFGLNDGDGVDCNAIARKICALRVFADNNGKLMHDLANVDGAVLLVPQFTLYGDARKGRRPDFLQALQPSLARERFLLLTEAFLAITRVQTGEFGADMKLSLVNDGPFTLTLEF